MTIIDDSAELARFCQRLGEASYITVDTEFMREKTYWPRLCLVQLGGPEECAAVDPMVEGIDLAPLFELMTDPGTLKVFHAARQDIEIFYNLTGKVPSPLFDTQVAAMVCGFGDAVGYETLASRLARARIDKSSRFTDWARRPLTERQVQYALSDVTHLRVVYEKLSRELEKTGRMAWLEEEEATLIDPATYASHPEDAWRRLKLRSTKPRFLGILREVTDWRERQAQSRDIPRQRVLRDEALIEIAAHPPKDSDQLARIRGMSRGLANGRSGSELLAAVKRGVEIDPAELPKVQRPPPTPPGIGPLVELLKVLLKLKCESHHVARKLVASSADLEQIAADDFAEVRALHGWRREIFGVDALELKHGRLALSAAGDAIKLVRLEPPEGDAPTAA
jgi:ribonuclease D